MGREALGRAGDLNNSAHRDHILVIREEGGQRVTYELNLLDQQSIFNSPAYYLQQNDVIYVEMNKKQKRNATVMGNSVVQPSFWMGLATFVVSALAWFNK